MNKMTITYYTNYLQLSYIIKEIENSKFLGSGKFVDISSLVMYSFLSVAEILYGARRKIFKPL